MKKLLTLLFCFAATFNLSAQVNISYLWHMQQPIYWPDKSRTNPAHYQTAKESYDIKMSGGNRYGTNVSHPTNNLKAIFGKADRVDDYQQRVKNAVKQLLSYPKAGAQVSYPGCLIENVNSLANASQWGYHKGWNENFVTARGWKTSGGFPRLDIVGFTFHHALAPLISTRAFRKELEAYRLIYGNTFGHSPEFSQGFWPAECSFSERMIEVLDKEGFSWTVVANSHLARTLSDYPLHFGTNGCNISPPNRADKVPAKGKNWWNGQIDGRGGEFAAPYCYQVHKAKYVDPETGKEYYINVVPMADLLSYKDGYSPQGTGDIDKYIKPFDDPSHPSLVLFAHDGDNSWGGGYSYYFQAVPNFVSAATQDGMTATTIQQFLHNHPVPADDVVHVEDGSWVNAANDWGSPQFINWLWPLYNPSTYTFDPNAWNEDARNWAVITAIDNYVCMAEDLSGKTDISKIVYSDTSSSNAEKAWHFYLPALTSGYMYYGTAEDMEVKQTLAGNNAIAFARKEIAAHAGIDNTPPSVFIPQRFPYNPGGKEFGPVYGYKEHISNKDFTVWTYGYDVSGIRTAVLKYRLDKDGVNPLSDNDNDTYAGGPGVGPWKTVTMHKKLLDSTFNGNNNNIDFFILPKAIARLYYAKISGLSDTLVDYYVEMTDRNGNIYKTPIQHVFVGNASSGEDNGSDSTVFWSPEKPTTKDTITIYSKTAVNGSKLHWGVTVEGKHWITPDKIFWPQDTKVAGGAVETPFTGPAPNGMFYCTLGPFNDTRQTVQQVDFVIKINDNRWDNNNGQDYHIPLKSVVSDSFPKASNGNIIMLKSSIYSFSSNDFGIQASDSALFGGLIITFLPNKGKLEYAGQPALINKKYTKIHLFQYTPPSGETGRPFSRFGFKALNRNLYAEKDIHTMTIWVFDHYADSVSWYPAAPTTGNKIIIIVHDDPILNKQGGMLHWGVNDGSKDWTLPAADYWPYGTVPFGDGHAVETPFTKVDSNTWKVVLGPFNLPEQTVYSVNFVLHYGNNTWNNHEGNDWKIPLYLVGIKEKKQQQAIRIFPNPVKNKAVITLTTTHTAARMLYILNVTGKVVKSVYIGREKQVVFYNHLIPGIYFIKVFNEKTGETFIKKMVVF